MARVSIIPIMKAHPLWSLLMILLFGSGVFLLAYLPIRYGGAYKAAKVAVIGSPFVRSMVGPKPKVTLDWWGGNREMLILGGSGQSTATIRLGVRGTLGGMRLRLHMEKVHGAWKVESVSSNGRAVSLSSPSGG